MFLRLRFAFGAPKALRRNTVFQKNLVFAHNILSHSHGIAPLSIDQISQNSEEGYTILKNDPSCKMFFQRYYWEREDWEYEM